MVTLRRFAPLLALLVVVCFACGKQEAPKATEEKAAAKKEEKKAEPAKEEKKAEPAKEEKKAEPAKEEKKAEPAKEEKKAEPAKEEKKAEPAKEEKKAEPVAAAGEKVEEPELKPIEVPTFKYPEFTGKKIALAHTCNLIGELEPCG
jgi:hypothetical protein